MVTDMGVNIVVSMIAVLGQLTVVDILHGLAAIAGVAGLCIARYIGALGAVLYNCAWVWRSSW
ncbi:MAG: hypothetical protein AB1553_00435 [Nitrospirota bacterium]